MRVLPKSRAARLRAATIVTLPVVVVFAYLLWSPGQVVTDGSHDRRSNGIWLSHGWLGDDRWFANHKQRDTLPPFREAVYIEEQAAFWRRMGIVDLFPHLAPVRADGHLPGVDAAQVELLLDHTEGLHVMPWIGGVLGRDVHPSDSAWRSSFTAQVAGLLSNHPRLAGVHLNVEPWPSDDADMLVLLEELKAALPGDAVLSVAAYPPPTHWHPHPDLHWDESYFRQIAARCDHLAVMMYDTALRWRKPYRKLMADWTEQVLTWSGNTPVLLGVPAYEDAGVGYHDPNVENVDNALWGIHAGLMRFKTLPANYRGIAIYSGWTTDEEEWSQLRRGFFATPQ